MIQITMEEWKAISKDYKGGKVGQRQVFAGCICKGIHPGTTLLTEGINFTIVKERSHESKSKTG